MTLSRKTRQEMHDNALIDTAVSMCFLAAGLVLNGEFGIGDPENRDHIYVLYLHRQKGG